MNFMDKLEKLDACSEGRDWVQEKTIEEAWKKCKNPRWMIWALSQTDLDLIDPICEMAERVLHLVPEDSKLACIWAISAAKRRASKDELAAARAAAHDAASSVYASAVDAAFVSAAYYAARAAAASAASSSAAVAAAARTSSEAAASAVRAAADADDSAANEAKDTYAYSNERKKQCDILRKYFTLEQVKEAFSKIVA